MRKIFPTFVLSLILFTTAAFAGDTPQMGRSADTPQMGVTSADQNPEGASYYDENGSLMSFYEWVEWLLS